MIKEVKTYYVSDVPNDDDINEAISKAASLNVIVKLFWHVPYSGDYEMYIGSEDTLETVKEHMPKMYGI
jgi:hypothetical protein